MGDELKFQQRWEFRRKENDFESSSEDSRSSSIGEPVLKRHKLVSDLSSLDYEQTHNTSGLQQNCNSNPGVGDEIEFAKAKEKKIKSGKKNNFADSEVKRDCREEVSRKKGTTIVYDPAAIDDVKNFSGSLLEDLKSTRENLFTWMREEMNKLVADDTAPRRGRRKRISRGKKVQLQHHNNFEKNVHFQPQNNTEDNIQGQQMNNNGATAPVQQQTNFEEDNEVQNQNHFEKNIQMQHQNNFKSAMRVKNCIVGSLDRATKSIKSADTNDHSRALDDQIDYGQSTGPIASIEKGKRERSAVTMNSNFQSGPSNEEVQVQHPKSVVLAIRAQQSVKGKKTAELNKRNQVPEDQVGSSQAIGSITSTENDKAERFRLSVEQSFSPIPFDQVPSSMYLSLPTVLTKPYDSNNWQDTFLSDYAQPRVPGNKISVNLERTKQMHDSSSHFGSIPIIQPEERSANFVQMGSRYMSCFDQNGTQTSSTGAGLPISVHKVMNGGYSLPSHLLGNIPQESGDTLGRRINGGAITFSGGSYALSENFDANNLLSHSNYIADGRLMPYQIPSIKDGYLFPK